MGVFREIKNTSLDYAAGIWGLLKYVTSPVSYTFGYLKEMYGTSVPNRLKRIPLGEENIKKIKSESLYHFIKMEHSLEKRNEICDKILESGYLRAEVKLNKNNPVELMRTSIQKAWSLVSSLGEPRVFMFEGVPSIDHWAINAGSATGNPTLSVSQIYHAVEVTPEDSDLEKMETRPANDATIIHRGDYYFDKSKARHVQFVVDIVKNPVTEKHELGFRERTAQEIKDSPDKHIPSRKMANLVRVRKSILNPAIAPPFIIRAQRRTVKLENRVEIPIVSSIRNKLADILSKKDIDDKTRMQKTMDILESPSQLPDDIVKLISKKVLKHRDLGVQKIFGEVANFIKKSENFSYLQAFAGDRSHEKYYNATGSHDIGHVENTTLFAYYISEKMGFDKESLEIILEAARYHDMGRKNDLPMSHGKAGARKYLEEVADLNPERRDFELKVAFLIHAHDKRPQDVERLAKKYFPNMNQTKLNKLIKMANVLRDSDALDRARFNLSITSNNLDSGCLCTKPAKEIIKFAQELNYLQKGNLLLQNRSKAM